MKRALLASLITIGVSLTAYADVTLKQTTTGKGMGMSGTTSAVTYIQGNKTRTDTTLGDRTQTMIFDLDAQKMFMFDSKSSSPRPAASPTKPTCK